MAYTNSPLVTYTKISPNRGNYKDGEFIGYERTHTIDTISIHCVVGQLSVERLGNVFAPTSTNASSNYGVGSDGRIGMYVEEKDRSWCTSSSSNDNRAVTIEVASDNKHPYAVNTKAYAALLDLVTDICKRNNIKELKWKADKSLIGQVDKQNMTVHRWFANKSCPGEYLYARMGEIAAEVNKRLNVNKVTNTTVNSNIKANDIVSIKDGATYYNGGNVPGWVKNKRWIVSEVKGDRAVINKSEDGSNSINSPINTKFLTVVNKAPTNTPNPTTAQPRLVKITTSALNIRRGAGTNYPVTGCIRDKGIYTIVSEAPGKGSTKGWGLLKSGAGWISLDYVTSI